MADDKPNIYTHGNVESLSEHREKRKDNAARKSSLATLMSEFMAHEAAGNESMMRRVGVRMTSKFTKNEINAAARAWTADRRAQLAAEAEARKLKAVPEETA